MEVLKEGYLIPFSSLSFLSQDPIPFTSYSLDSSQRDFVSHRERGGRVSSFLSGLLQPHVHRLEGVGLLETYNRPVLLEQVCSRRRPVSSPCSLEGRLDGFHRPEGRASSGPRPLGEPKVLSVCSVQESLSVQGPLFWSLHGPPSVYQGHGSGISHASQPRHLDFEISGGLVDSGLFQDRGLVGKGRCPGSMMPVRHSCELRQIPPLSVSVCDLP